MIKNRYEDKNHQESYYHTDPKFQLLMLALSARPDIESQLRQALNIIQGVSQTVTSLRRGMDIMSSSMQEAHRHIYSLSSGHQQKDYGYPKQNNNTAGPLPLDEDEK